MSRITSAIYILPKSNYFTEGGRGRVTHAIGVANGLFRNGLHVTVVSGPGLARFRSQLEKGVELVEIPKSCRKKAFLWEPSWQLRLLLHMKSLLRRDKDPVIITRYGPSSMFLQFLLAKGLLARRLVTAEVNSLAFHHFRRLPPYARRLMLRTESRFLALFDEIHVVSKQLEEDILSTGITKPVIVVPNASDVKRGFIHQGNLKTWPLRLIYLGQYHSYYDFRFFLTAFCTMAESQDNAELHFWGNGHLRKEISVTKNLESRIVFHGPYRLQDLEGQFNRASDVFILPSKPGSRAEITSPIKLFEYMSLGIPVVAADLGQVSEILQDRVTGYLYDPLDVRSLQELLWHIVKNPKERVSVGKRARKELESSHTWEKRMEFLIDELNRLRRRHVHFAGSRR
ncbi:MAG: glycosyltransferase family 4 protein [Candidatus Neomarinimicrobiota bacterium]